MPNRLAPAASVLSRSSYSYQSAISSYTATGAIITPPGLLAHPGQQRYLAPASKTAITACRTAEDTSRAHYRRYGWVTPLAVSYSPERTRLLCFHGALVP